MINSLLFVGLVVAVIAAVSIFLSVVVIPYSRRRRVVEDDDFVAVLLMTKNGSRKLREGESVSVVDGKINLK